MHHYYQLLAWLLASLSLMHRSASITLSYFHWGRCIVISRPRSIRPVVCTEVRSPMASFECPLDARWNVGRRQVDR